MDDIEKCLVTTVKALNEAREVLAQLRGIDLEPLEIQEALQRTLQLDDPVKLIEKNLTTDTIIEKLLNYDFRKPDVVQIISIDESIVPSSFPRLLTEQWVKHKGEVWEIHKYDKDPFPSNPHAHNRETGLKLHLGTGTLFKKREEVGSIGKKALQTLRQKISDISLPPLEN